MKEDYLRIALIVLTPDDLLLARIDSWL